MDVFLPNLLHVLFPLYRLLWKSTLWRWSKVRKRCFNYLRNCCYPRFYLFILIRELVLACDASPYGIGAVLACPTEPFVSRTLTKAEKNYAQIEREGLACIYGIKKFHSFIFGRLFTLITDNLPLKSLFSEKLPIPQHASGRIQRWSLTLASYQYKIEFRPTYKNGNADAFSRLPRPVVANEEIVPTELVLLMEAMNDLPITCENIKD